MKRPMFLKIPCGKILGYGVSCKEGHLCDRCQYIVDLEKQLDRFNKPEIGPWI